MAWLTRNRKDSAVPAVKDQAAACRAKWLRRAAVGAALSTAIFVALSALGGWLETRAFTAKGPATKRIVVVIAPGTPLGTVARQLADAKAVRSATLFRLGVRRRGAATHLQAGEYAIAPGASEADILEMLAQGRAIQHHVTIAEGLTSAMAVAALNADPVLTGTVDTVPPEGSLLPETYAFERGTTRAQILARMHKAQTTLLDELWPKRAANLPITTKEDALILASIVEKETAVPAERAHIAGVFMNRLRRHMRLESDPTIIYGLTGGAPLGHGLRVSELAKLNPYSTYQIDGLPPTPICNPGRDAIAAVLHPNDTDDLYFVSDGDGGHAFAMTMAKHARNVARLRKIERDGTAH